MAQKKKELADLKAKFVEAKVGGDPAALAAVMQIFGDFEEKKNQRMALSANKAALKKEEAGPVGTKQWTLEELQKKPAGLNPNALENYLSDAAFKQVFKMGKTQFKDLPDWKKKKLKTDNGLI